MNRQRRTARRPTRSANATRLLPTSRREPGPGRASTWTTENWKRRGCPSRSR